jgi:hypothetical protein
VTTRNDLFQEWRAADRQAHAMEKLITKASLAALEGQGVGPTPEDREKAHGLRHAADDLFALAMAEMKERAASYRRY